MRIVVIADSIDLQEAGIHVYTRQMIEHLEYLERHEIICIRQGKRKDIKFKNDVIVKGLLPFLEKDPSRVFYSIPKAIKKLKPDMVIEPAHFGPFNLPHHIKRVTIIHDLTPVIFPQWHSKISSLLQKLFLPSILKKADLIVTNSIHTQNDLNKYYPVFQAKTVCIYPGINPFFSVRENEITYNKEPFLLSTGTIEPRKNLSLLLDAFEEFKRNSKSKLKLVICGGKGWKNSDFHKKLMVHPYKNEIELKGYVSNEELKSLYAKTAAFIYPSLYEGFGFPVAEALACGAPCIVSNTSSLPEVGGEAVIYFDPKSTNDLVTKMLLFTPSIPGELYDTNKGIIQASKFNWNSFAVQLEKYLLRTQQ